MLHETGEAPVTLILGKAMVGSMVDVQTRVVWIPKDKGKLQTRAPVLGYLIWFVAMFEVDGALVDVIAVGKK
jgi:hypothetical protein